MLSVAFGRGCVAPRGPTSCLPSCARRREETSDNARAARFTLNDQWPTGGAGSRVKASEERGTGLPMHLKQRSDEPTPRQPHPPSGPSERVAHPWLIVGPIAGGLLLIAVLIVHRIDTPTNSVPAAPTPKAASRNPTMTSEAIRTRVALAVQATQAAAALLAAQTATAAAVLITPTPACCDVLIHLRDLGVELANPDVQGGYRISVTGCLPGDATRPDVMGDWRGAPFRLRMDSACVNSVEVDVAGYARSNRVRVERPLSETEVIIRLTPIVSS